MNASDRIPHLDGPADPRTRRVLTPCRVVTTAGDVRGAAALTAVRPPQVTLGGGQELAVLQNGAEGARAAVLLDFGVELHGTLTVAVHSLTNPAGKTVDVRIRLGESVGEALTPIGERGTTNDHATRDFVLPVSFYSANESPESGFRFAWVELVTPSASLRLYAVTATLIFRDLPLLGRFSSSDAALDKIYDTAVYTVQLNMQRYLWDGIKRDRLVWAGDMNTEIHTILAAFGAGTDVVPASLDLVRDVTPAGEAMNGLSSYSLWWTLSQYDWFLGSGDLAYLETQKEYLKTLLRTYFAYIGEDGAERLPEGRFFDWPNRASSETTHAGLQGLFRYVLLRAGALMKYLGEDALSADCIRQADRLLAHRPDPRGQKQVAAFLALSGLADAGEMWRGVIAPGGAEGLSTFLGYYTLCAAAKAGEIPGALALIRGYWGRMLSLGATTFWEDFDVRWAENAARIDELPVSGKSDVHGDFGAFCYRNFRHSLCHGWASGPAPFLSRHVLGVRPFAPGFSVVRFAPDLGDLAWAKGSVPTPHGPIEVELERGEGGRTLSRIVTPDGVRLLGGR